MTLDGEGSAGVSMEEAARRILKDALVRAGAPTCGSYQTLINQALRDAAQGVTLAEVVRQTIRQELHLG